MNSDRYEPRACEICGRMYKPGKKNQKTCGSEECQAERRRRYANKWKEENYGSACEKNREYMRRRRKGAPPKIDTIVAIGYAERQMAKTLAMVSPIKTKL